MRVDTKPNAKFLVLVALWGVAEGILAWLIVRIGSQGRLGDRVFLAATLLVSISSTLIVFWTMSEWRRWQALAFPIASSLLPLMLVIGGDSFYYGRLDIELFDLFFALGWALLLLPFSIGSALAFYLLTRFARRAPM